MRALNLLTDREIKAALRGAQEAGKPVTLNDGGGLRLEVQPSGAAWWRFRYWLGTRENRLSFGVYPDVPLRSARDKRDEARRNVAAGVDPSEDRKKTRAAVVAAAEVDRLAAQGLPTPDTFQYVAEDWLSRMHEPSVSPSHAKRNRARLEQNVYPWLGRRPIADIEPADLLGVLRKIEDRGAIETAHRVKDLCGQVFRYGIVIGKCKRNPAADLRDALAPVPTRHHAAIVDPDRAGELLRAVRNYHGHPVTRLALMLSALLFQRPGEMRQLEWAWVDVDDALLTIPPALMKRRKADKVNGSPHLVPLAPQALALLEELRALTGNSRYLFPAVHTAERCMSDNTVNVALRRIGFDRNEATAHGFRAMARTMAAERLDIAPAVIEAQLAHAVADPLGRAYNRTQYLAQRRELMARWADYLDRLAEGQSLAK